MSSKIEEVDSLLKYLGTLQEGKVRPNYKGHGVVRDAKDNLPEIKAVKDKLNVLLELDLETINELRNNE